ncbi:MAG: hypothetical protein AABY14_03640, partial [Nanoarchaeota archaeon]
LRFLKDTVDAGLINEDEFEREKERISLKLNSSLITQEDKIIEKEIVEQKNEQKIEVLKEDVKEEGSDKVDEVHLQEPDTNKSEEKPDIGDMNNVAEDKKEESLTLVSEQHSGDKWFKYGVIAVVIIAIFVAFSFISAKETKTLTGTEDINLQNTNTPKITEKAINLIIINDNSCKTCNSERMINVIKQLFQIKESYLDISNADAMSLLEELSISSLPAYIFDSEIENTASFKKFSSALIKKGEKYVIAPSASGSSYFFKAEPMSKKLEIFLLEGDELNKKVKDNIEGFLIAFKGELTYVEHIVKKEDLNELKEELGITTFPTFLINNQYKEVGVMSAEMLKQDFCEVNKLEKCSKSLSKEIK